MRSGSWDSDLNKLFFSFSFIFPFHLFSYCNATYTLHSLYTRYTLYIEYRDTNENMSLSFIVRVNMFHVKIQMNSLNSNDSEKEIILNIIQN